MRVQAAPHQPGAGCRFPAVIDFPGYIADQLAALAEEAGFTLTPAAICRAATVRGHAENRHQSGNARLAVRLLDQATTSQARRVTAPWTVTEWRDDATV